MKVEITTPPGIFAEGSLERILSQHGAPYPHIVIEMKVTGSNHPVKITLDTLDLSTIARLAKGSTIKQIQDAIRVTNVRPAARRNAIDRRGSRANKQALSQ